jgi:hypothetical protein
MLPLLFALIAYLFLLIGTLAFLFCVAIPYLRCFALSVALWCAMWGPCSIVALTIAGLALVTSALVAKSHDPSKFQNPHLLSTFGLAYVICGALVTAIVAFAVAWLHQFLMHRLTFAMFRLYSTAVVAGIGSVFGWAMLWWMLSHDVRLTWEYSLLIMFSFIAGFGTSAYKGAAKLRGTTPKALTWITEEEFAGG